MKPLVIIPAAVGLLAAGCGRAELTGPPELRPGRDECAECGMLIHDERSAGAVLVERDGRREHLLFDDVGCMLDHERQGGGTLRILERFARDYRGGGWLGTDQAAFLMTESDLLRTPMGSGIAAFADRAAAEAAEREFGGEVMDYAALADARRAWLGELRGPSPGGP